MLGSSKKRIGGASVHSTTTLRITVRLTAATRTMFDRLEALKHKIHNTRIPIRNKKLLFAVKTVYFFTPVVVGYGIMQMVIPDPEEMKKKMGPPSEYAAALTKYQKDGLREVLEQAQARQAQAQK